MNARFESFAQSTNTYCNIKAGDVSWCVCAMFLQKGIDVMLCAWFLHFRVSFLSFCVRIPIILKLKCRCADRRNSRSAPLDFSPLATTQDKKTFFFVVLSWTELLVVVILHSIFVLFGHFYYPTRKQKQKHHLFHLKTPNTNKLINQYIHHDYLEDPRALCLRRNRRYLWKLLYPSHRSCQGAWTNERTNERTSHCIALHWIELPNIASSIGFLFLWKAKPRVSLEEGLSLSRLFLYYFVQCLI